MKKATDIQMFRKTNFIKWVKEEMEKGRNLEFMTNSADSCPLAIYLKTQYNIPYVMVTKVKKNSGYEYEIQFARSEYVETLYYPASRFIENFVKRVDSQYGYINLNQVYNILVDMGELK